VHSNSAGRSGRPSNIAASMLIRETIERHQKASRLIGLLIIVTALGSAYTFFRKPTNGTETGQWFTVDDGATYFVDSSDPIPPFDHNGKTAVKAHLAREDSGSALKVIYLERLTPAARAAAAKIRAKSPVSAEELRDIATGQEYKVPGESQWHTFRNQMDLPLWAHGLAEKQGCGKSGFVDPG
jgi:hypothetical protein